MNVLVTGGAGFIGSHLVRALHGRGDRVVVLDNLSTGSRANLAGLPIDLVVADLTEADQVRAAVRGMEVVFHLGAMISVPLSFDNPAACYQTNLLGSLHVLEAARREGVRRVVLASSCAIYGDRDRPAREDDPARPTSPYAGSKVAMEDLARLYGRAFSVESVILRYFNVYGPGQDPRSPYAAAIPLFLEALLAGQAPLIHGDGRQSRDFVFVEDVVAANLQAAQASAAAGQTFNIASGTSASLLEVMAILRRLLPSSPDPAFGQARPGDIRSSAADIARAAEALGYRPAHDLHQGLLATVEWMRARPKPSAE